MKVRLSLFIAIFFGALTLLGYFIPHSILPFFQDMQSELIRTGVFLGVIATALGVGNLLKVHMRRSVSGKPGWANSIMLVISFALTFILVFSFSFIADPYSSKAILWVVQYMLVPLEAGLSAVLAFVLLAGGARLLHRRMGWLSVVFLISSLLVIIAMMPLPWGFGDMELLSGVSLNEMRSSLGNFVMVIASGGGRGILIGMALGAAATGMRILMGIDRPYER